MYIIAICYEDRLGQTMCGIAGVLNFDGQEVSREFLKRMGDSLVHRGPDGEGFFTDGPVGLVHRRLSIIDLSTGDQPMFSEDRNYCIVYNGELYNFQEIKSLLCKKGYIFRTQSDTEVIIYAFQEWREKCLDLFRGMFSFVIWDKSRKTLFAARDRVGVKPFFYYLNDSKFIFGSEIKAILQDKLLDRTIDLSALCEYLQYGYIPSPKTIYSKICKLPPAHYLFIKITNESTDLTAAPQPYWNFRYQPNTNKKESEWLQEIESTLSESVKLHMISDVPIGAFLSGGVDSSAVSVLMAKFTDHLKTFTIGLNEEGYDESPYAREVADIIKSDHFEKIVTPDHIENLLPKLVWHYDEPFADSSAVPTYYISNVIRDHVTVALSGDGGDEVFGGYQRYGDIVKYDMDIKSENAVQKTIRTGMKNVGGILPKGFVGKNYLTYKTLDPVKRYYGMVNIFSNEQVRRMLPALSAPSYRSDIFSEYTGPESGDEFLSKIQNIDMHTYLPENNLTKVDRASMAHSIEVRVPLLDHKLIELLAQTPSVLRMKDFDKKYLLKSVMLKHLPKDVLYRRKRGFSLPMKDWFRNNQNFANLATHTILKNDLIREYFDSHFIQQMINEHMHTKKNHSSRLWSLFFLSIWYDDYFKKI